jgi:hypothetical protein
VETDLVYANFKQAILDISRLRRWLNGKTVLGFFLQPRLIRIS